MSSSPKFRNDWPIPAEYMLELGRLSCVWATLEGQLNLFIGKLAGFNDLNDATPFILTAHASFPQRLDMLGALCAHLSPAYPNLNEHGDVVSKMKAAQALRNRFIHNGIAPGEMNDQFVLVHGSARGKLKANVTPITPDDIRAATAKVNEAARALYKLVLGVDIPEAGQPHTDRSQ